jgi:FkbM family methyltransferase
MGSTRALVKALVRKPYPPSARPWLRHSFSQAGEDRIVAFVFDALNMRRPSYLDIGAYHPYHLSNTALLYQSGSVGINVEPDPQSFARIQRHRRNDTNINAGVGVEPDRLTFYQLTAPTLNTFSREAAEEAVEASRGRFRIESTIDVDVRTVPDILAGRPCPDFLSLDVEGLDLAILRTMPRWNGLPIVVCVETITYSEVGRGAKVPAIGEELAEHGFIAYADTNINTIFVREDRWIR